jgi:hypothetical protein
MQADLAVGIGYVRGSKARAKGGRDMRAFEVAVAGVDKTRSRRTLANMNCVNSVVESALVRTFRGSFTTTR